MFMGYCMRVSKIFFFVLLMFIFHGAHAADRAWNLLKDAQFKKIYPAALGVYAQTPWLAKLGGPSSPNSAAEIDGNIYVVFSTCKQHECNTSNMLGIYSKELNRVYGLILIDGKLHCYGNPSDRVKSQLHALYVKENPEYENTPFE